MRKNILVVLPNDNLGGAEQYLKMVAEYFSENEYAVDVFFLKQRMSGAWDHLESDRFKLYFTKSHREAHGIFALLWSLIRNRAKYKYAFTSHIHVNSFISMLRKLTIVKAEYQIARESTMTFERYSGLKLMMFKAHYVLNYNHIDLLICQTELMHNKLKKAIPNLFKHVKVLTVPNPVNSSAIRDAGKNELLPVSDFIVSAGRLIPEKGFDVLIESFYRLREKWPNLNLVILGEGLLRNKLQKKICDLGVEKHVFLPGFVENVYPYFYQAKLCVVSSRVEGFPNVLLQMMSQNNKVVSTLCAGGIAEIAGIELAEVDDVESLVKAMETALWKDTDNNSLLFKEELTSRSISSFIARIQQELVD